MQTTPLITIRPIVCRCSLVPCTVMAARRTFTLRRPRPSVDVRLRESTSSLSSALASPSRCRDQGPTPHQASGGTWQHSMASLTLMKLSTE